MAGLIKIIHRYVGCTEEVAKARLNGPDSLQLEEMVQGQINRAKEGDATSFKFLIEIMCGKIPEADDASPLDGMTAKEKLEAMKLAIEALELQVKKDGE